MVEHRVLERPASRRLALPVMVVVCSLTIGSTASGLDASDHGLRTRPSGGVTPLACSVVEPDSGVTTLTPQSAAAGQRFGRALARGDFDGDGLTDVVVGIPSYQGAGAVMVYEGGPAGYASGTVRDQHHASAGNEAGDRFGEALAAGDLDRDGFSDLVVGAPGEDVGSVADAGAVVVFLGSRPPRPRGRSA